MGVSAVVENGQVANMESAMSKEQKSSSIPTSSPTVLRISRLG